MTSQRSPQSPSNSTSRRAFWLLLALTLVVRGGVLLAVPQALEADPDGYRRLAENLWHHGTLGYGEQPTAYRPPLYPLLLTPCVALGRFSTVGIGLLHVLLGVVTVLGTVRLARRWGLERSAWVAGVLVAIDPLLVWQSTLVMTETLATLLTVLALNGLTAAAQTPSLRRAAMAAAWIGLAALCRPTYVPWLACSAVLLPWFAEGAAARVKTFLVFCITGAAVLAPWVLRNQIQFGKPIVGTTHGGYTLLLGNNPWFYDYLRHGAWGTLWDGNQLDRWWLTQASRETPADELRSDQRAYEVAHEAIRQQPEMFAYSCLVHIARLWSPLPHRTEAAESGRRAAARRLVGVWYLGEYGLALLGLAAVWRRERWAWRNSWSWGLLLALLFTAVHSVYWSNIRMRAPLVPLVVLAVVAGGAVLGQWRCRAK